MVNEAKNTMCNWHSRSWWHGLLSIGKVANTKMDKNTKEKIFFKDVASCDEEKQGIMEVVHFLKKPKTF